MSTTWIGVIAFGIIAGTILLVSLNILLGFVSMKINKREKNNDA